MSNKVKMGANWQKIAEGLTGQVSNPGVNVEAPMVIETFDVPTTPVVPPVCNVQSGECQSATLINLAISECKYNSHCYRQAASTMKLAGLDEFHKYLKCMAGKWHDCSKSFVHLIENLGCAVNFIEVKPVCNIPCGPQEIATFFCGLEESELCKLEELVKSTDGNDVVVHEFLCHKLEKHVKMVSKACAVSCIFAQSNGNFLLADHSCKHLMRG
jgi:hypothetical protein